MKIRNAVISAAPSLAVFGQSVQDMHADAIPGRFRKNVSKEMVERAFVSMIESPSSYWLVAEEDELIGFPNAEFRNRDESWCSTCHRVCYLAGTVVAPDSRRKGVAGALVEELKREASARHVSSIELDVLSFNTHARQAFSNLGFRGIMERMTLDAE